MRLNVKKRIILTVISLLLLVSIFACGKDELPGHAELVIPLPDGYREFEAEDFDAAYENDGAVVGIVRISFEAGFASGIPETLMPEDFAEFYMKKVGRDEAIQLSGTVPYYQYIDTDGVENVYELVSFYRSKYAYFIIFFACPESGYEERKLEFLASCEQVWFLS